jgi:UDPglucose--hexose-1-phosphate uridylyltransferase
MHAWDECLEYTSILLFLNLTMNLMKMTHRVCPVIARRQEKSHFIGLDIKRFLSGNVLRFCEMSGTWVVYSRGRKDRPKQTPSSTMRLKPLDSIPQHVENCPFCVGNEHMTPKVLFQTETMRVVSNLYPAVAELSETYRRHHQYHETSQVFEDLHPLNNEVPAVGFHEVVIESPRHNAHLATSESNMAWELLQCFVERGNAHREFPDVEHTVFFKNHGPTAGASLVHPHSQIVSTPVVPVEAERLQQLARRYFKRTRTSLYQTIVHEEVRLYEKQPDQSRVVSLSEHFLAIVPYASTGPYMVTILPRYDKMNDCVDGSDFLSTPKDLLEECATILQSSLRKLHLHLNEPCFNMVLQTAPVAGRGVQAAFQASTYFRWHIRITPRLGAGAMAGFELGSGFFSNSHMPEDDAMELRTVEA